MTSSPQPKDENPVGHPESYAEVEAEGQQDTMEKDQMQPATDLDVIQEYPANEDTKRAIEEHKEEVEPEGYTADIVYQSKEDAELEKAEPNEDVKKAEKSNRKSTSSKKGDTFLNERITMERPHEKPIDNDVNPEKPQLQGKEEAHENLFAGSAPVYSYDIDKLGKVINMI